MHCNIKFPLLYLVLGIMTIFGCRVQELFAITRSTISAQSSSYQGTAMGTFYYYSYRTGTQVRAPGSGDVIDGNSWGGTLGSNPGDTTNTYTMELHASPYSGYKFTGWTGDSCNNSDSLETAMCSITATPNIGSSQNYYWSFAPENTCATNHYKCDESGSTPQSDGTEQTEYNSNADMTHYWTWICDDPYTYCHEDMTPECSTTTKDTCVVGRLKADSSSETATEWKWDCETGMYEPDSAGNDTKTTSCTLKKPPVCSTTEKGKCQNGVAGQVSNPPTKITKNGKDYNKYTWDCTVTDATPDTESCPFEVELCNGQELQDNEFCCSEDDAENPNALNDSNGTLIGDDEVICNTDNNDKCFIRRLCSDSNNNEQHGEDGSPDPNNADFVSCNHEIICASAVVHSCDKNSANNNCQDECHPSVSPKPEMCFITINGVCGDWPTKCTSGTMQDLVPAFQNRWWCLGSLEDANANPPTHKGTDVLCEIKNGVCGTEKYTCTYSSIGNTPTITPPGYVGNTFQWSCLGDIGGTDALNCIYTCPGEQVIDPDLKTCIDPPPDLCSNIADIQDPVPAGMTRFPSGNCCTDPQVWDTITTACVDPLTVTCTGAPDPAGTGQVATWTSTITGGVAIKNYTWSGTDTLTGNTANTSKMYVTSGTKTANVAVTSGSQSLADTCTIQVNVCSVTPPTMNSIVCTDGPVPALNGAAGVLVDSCVNTVACDWICSDNYYKSGNTCLPYVCQGTVPSNALLCDGDETGLTSNINRSLVNTCGTTKCEYTCQAGFTNIGGVCTANICSTTPPDTNSEPCNDGPIPTTNNLTGNLVNSCTATAQCDWKCKTGYIFQNGVCTPLPPTPTGLTATASECGNNWLNISWNASLGATNYKVYQGATLVYDGPDLFFSDLNLIPGSSYSYTIKASNVLGISALSLPPVRGIVSSLCDQCANLPDAQLSIPDGFVQSGADCVCM